MSRRASPATPLCHLASEFHLSTLAVAYSIDRVLRKLDVNGDGLVSEQEPYILRRLGFT